MIFVPPYLISSVLILAHRVGSHSQRLKIEFQIVSSFLFLFTPSFFLLLFRHGCDFCSHLSFLLSKVFILVFCFLGRFLNYFFSPFTSFRCLFLLVASFLIHEPFFYFARFKSWILLAVDSLRNIISDYWDFVRLYIFMQKLLLFSYFKIFQCLGLFFFPLSPWH